MGLVPERMTDIPATVGWPFKYDHRQRIIPLPGGWLWSGKYEVIARWKNDFGER
jgi:hypothetical protein